MENLSDLLQQTIDRELPHLRGMEESRSSRQPKSGAWSPREELGHLIDSATNNHVRFVRAALEDDFRGPSYAQDAWVELHGYAEMAWPDLVELWHRYNTLLARLVSRIPETRLDTRMIVGESLVTLRFVVDDYVLHMQHHLDHLLAREVVTPYPREAVYV